MEASLSLATYHGSIAFLSMSVGVFKTWIYFNSSKLFLINDLLLGLLHNWFRYADIVK